MATNLSAPSSPTPTTKSTPLARGAQVQSTLDEAIESLTQSGIVGQLAAIAPHASHWTGTPANREAYTRGIDRGARGRALENPYPFRPNSMHLRGVTDTNAAFHEGWVDGVRIRGMVKDPCRTRDGVHPSMRTAEVRIFAAIEIPGGRAGALIQGANQDRLL